ncbi:MAG: cupin domain-containing protein [Thermoplasmata archaeon]
MRVILDHTARKGAIRGDRAWAFFCGTKLSPEGDEGFWGFANWLWNALAKKTGNLNRDSRGPVIVSIPELEPAAMDFVARLVSFWSTDVRERRGRTLSGNRWRAPVVNVLNDQAREGAEKTLVRETDADGSTELNLMPLLGPGRAFFSVQVIEKGGVTARMHSHSAVDEYYLILEGKGTLRYNGRAVPVKRGDIIGKPTGPDAATHLLANRGERLRILDMEIWHERFTGTPTTAKDIIYWPDTAEVYMRGPGWGALIPRDAMVSTTDLETHWSEAYRRTKDGKRRITKSRAWTK